MKSTKLFELILSLNSAELLQFGEYVHSPMINKRKKIIRLVDFILQHVKKWEHNNFSKSKASRYVFENKPHSDTAFNNILSDTLQLLYQFIAFTAYQKNTSIQQNLLSQELIRRNALGHAQKQLKKQEQSLLTLPVKDADFYKEAFVYYERSNQFFLKKVRRGFDVNLQKMQDSFNSYFMLRSLQIACEMASRNVVTQAQYNYKLFELYYQVFEAQVKHVDSINIQIYRKTFLLITDAQNPVHYNQLRTLLKEQSNALSPNELNDIYGYILNYCIQAINRGETRFYAEIFDWYKILLKDKIIFENEQLSDKTFMNIVTSSLRMKAYDWTTQFIYDYNYALKDKIRANAVAFNMAALYYAQNDYNKALLQLIDVEFTDSFYHIGAKIIQLKSYFHLEETNAFLALNQALRQYIQRNKQLSTYHKKANLNFLRFAKQLYQLQLNKPLVTKAAWSKKQQVLHIKLHDADPVSNKEWLREVLT